MAKNHQKMTPKMQIIGGGGLGFLLWGAQGFDYNRGTGSSEPGNKSSALKAENFPFPP